MPFKNVFINHFPPIVLLQIINIAILIVAISLLIFSVVFVDKPGPSVYYSHFTTIYLSSCLAFQCLQFILQARTPSKHHGKRRRGFKYAYWIILTLCGLMAGIAYAFTPKPDCVAVEILAFLDAAAALFCIQVARTKKLIDDQIVASSSAGNLIDQSHPGTVPKHPSTPAIERSQDEAQLAPRRVPGWLSKTFRIINRFLRVVHVLFSILAVNGAIQLALDYRFENPGTSIQITLPNGSHRSINVNCTSVPSSNGTSSPTIWIESSAAHGIVDFLGLAQHLTYTHSRNFCSYDPPNFGWSERLHSDYKNYYDYFFPMLEALGRGNEDIALVGWGGGVDNVVRHAIERPDIVKGLVLLDAAPAGIEWMDAQRANNWTEAEMLRYRSSDLSGRVELAQLILSLGIPCGFMPIFIPGNSTQYFDQSLYPRFRAQGMKEDMWAYQYYALRDMATGTIDNYLNTTTVFSSIPVYAIMVYNSSTTPGGNDLYRDAKLKVAERIGGGKLGAPAQWCVDEDCDLGFPVKKPAWTAAALMALGI